MILSPYKLFDSIAMGNSDAFLMLKSVSKYPWLIISATVFVYCGITAHFSHKLLTKLRYILQDDA